MSNLPASVQTSAEEADRQIAYNANGQHVPGAAPINGATAPVAVVVPNPDTAPAPASQAQPVMPAQSPVDDGYRDRFIGLKTYHDNTVRELRQGKQALESEVTALRAENKALKSASARNVDPFDSLSDDERVALGDDGLNAVRKITAAATQQVDATREELQELRTARQQDAEQKATSFRSGLASLVPNYLQIDADPAFHAWLAQVDPDTGAERQVGLTLASKSFDYQAVASIFNRYLLTAPTATTPTTQSALQPQQHITPATPVYPSTQTSPSGVPGQDFVEYEMWGQSEIDQFYREYEQFTRSRGNKDPNRLAEFVAMEQRITQAKAEGRVDINT